MKRSPMMCVVFLFKVILEKFWWHQYAIKTFFGAMIVCQECHLKKFISTPKSGKILIYPFYNIKPHN